MRDARDVLRDLVASLPICQMPDCGRPATRECGDDPYELTHVCDGHAASWRHRFGIGWEKPLKEAMELLAKPAQQPEPNASTYHPIIVSNQWGRLSYTVNGSPVTFSETDGPDVEWPDGHRSTERIRLVTEYTTIGDHGNTYDVTNRVPYVVGMVHGVESRIPLVALKLAVDENGRVVK